MLAKKIPKKRISKRRYPYRVCKNPVCGSSFIPNDARQQHCSPQCRVDFNNDQRKVKSAAVDKIAEILKRNEAILRKVTTALGQLNQKEVSSDILLYEGFNFNVISGTNINKNTGNEVDWQLFHGIEGANKERKTFIIHKRDKIYGT